MRTRTKYLLYIVFLHALTLVLSFYILRDNPLFFLISEALILISVSISWHFYRKLIQPLKSLMQSVDVLQSQEFTTQFNYTGNQEMDQLISVYNQMLERLRLERLQQQQQHYFLENLIYMSPTAILILNFEQEVETVNPKAVELLHLSEKELKGKRLDHFDHPFLRQVALIPVSTSKTISLGGADTFKVHVAQFLDRGFERKFILIEDLTREILIAEKNAYGKVIRMMAHEVNNTVGPVNTIVNSVLRNDELWTTEEDAQIKKALEIAIDRNDHLNSFMKGFADLVKLPAPNKKQVDIQLLLDHIFLLMQADARLRNIQMFRPEARTPFLVSADLQQLEQVVINIVKNALEAIGDNGLVEFIVDPFKKQLIIADNGRGIDPAVKDKLFSPFFSTKKNGQGLGLTLIREILTNHHFSFSLERVGEKTRFLIQF